MGFTLKSDEVREVKNMVDSIVPDLRKMAKQFDEDVAIYRNTRKVADAVKASSLLVGIVAGIATGGIGLLPVVCGVTGVTGGLVSSFANYCEDWHSRKTLKAMEMKYSSMREFKAFQVFVRKGIKMIQCRLVQTERSKHLSMCFRNNVNAMEVKEVFTMTFKALSLPEKIFALVQAAWNFMVSSTETSASREVRTMSSSLEEVSRKIDEMERETQVFARKHTSTDLHDWDIEFDEDLSVTEFQVGTINAYVMT